MQLSVLELHGHDSIMGRNWTHSLERRQRPTLMVQPEVRWAQDLER